MDSPHKTGYAAKNGQLVHISEVPRGLSCGCTCVVCGNQLIARKGHQRCHHFAHVAETDCHGAAETALHLISKELIKELSSIVLPPYNFVKTKKLKSGTVISHQKIIVEGGGAQITSTRIEPVCNGFVPDVILDCGPKKLIVEIAVTHKVDRNKLRRIRKFDLPAIEIQLELSDALLSRDELRKKLRDNISSKQWIFHPKQRNAERSFFEKLRAVIRGKNGSYLKPQPLPHSSDSRSPYYGVNKYDKATERFFKQHQRWPSKDECLTLWPHLWKKP